jgi:YfiH family protein
MAGVSSSITAPAPFEAVGEHLTIELPGARALFTSRHGGFSSGPYATLNLGRLTGDDAQAVRRNRGRLQEMVRGQLAMIHQVHGTRVRQIANGSAQAPDVTSADQQLEDADGQATADVGVAPMVLVADCLPVVVAGGGALAVLHAGWRGLAAGIVDEGVRAARELGSGESLEAAIGPGAGRCCYEVSEQVHEHFAAYQGARNGDNLDLKAVAREQLGRAGVAVVHDVGVCTICSADFFSHRRERAITGRQAGVAWLT